MELIPLIMFVCVCLALMLGFPVAFTLAGISLWFAGFGIAIGHFDPATLLALPDRLFGIINNSTLIAVPLFILMGVLLEKSKLAEELLGSMGHLLSNVSGGLSIAVVLVGALLAASTGIVGATVVTMGLISLPTMMRHNYSPALATGTICATGTLGQIIPPSIALVLLGDILSSAYQQAQLNQGVFNPDTISIGDLFIGALIPGLLLVIAYIAYIFIYSRLKPDAAPAFESGHSISGYDIIKSIFPPLALILLVLGSILAGIATPTEAAAIGALGACLLALLKNQLSTKTLLESCDSSVKVTAMIFMILIGAAAFSLVFKGFNGDELIKNFFADLPGGVMTATLLVMAVIFILGFILDFIEITFVVVPIVGPILLEMGINPIWLGIMIAINLQTSFLTPPFGFALFYLRGVADKSITTQAIYRGVVPFIIIQLLVLALLAAFPQLATWLPEYLL